MTTKKKVIQMTVLCVTCALFFTAFLMLVYRTGNLYTGVGGIAVTAAAAASAIVYTLHTESFIRLYRGAAIFTAPLAVYGLAAYPQLWYQGAVQWGLLFFSMIIAGDALLIIARKKLYDRHPAMFSGVYIADSVGELLSKYVSAAVILLFLYTAFSCLMGMDPELSQGIGFVGIAYRFVCT